MPGVTLPPDQNATLVRLLERVERLERQTRRPDAGMRRMLASLFSYPGTLVVDVESPRWYPEMDVTLSQTRISCTASNDVVVMVRKNGSDIYSVTLPFDQDTAVDFTVFSLNPGDYLTLRIDDIGTDGTDLSVGFVPSIGSS